MGVSGPSLLIESTDSMMYIMPIFRGGGGGNGNPMVPPPPLNKSLFLSVKVDAYVYTCTCSSCYSPVIMCFGTFINYS